MDLVLSGLDVYGDFRGAMRKVIRVTILVVVIFGALVLLSPAVIWCGRAQCYYRITVRSTEGGLIQGAKVDLMQREQETLKAMGEDEKFAQYMQHSKHRFISDEKGEGRLEGLFGAGGTSQGSFRWGSYQVRGDLVVSHPDYVEVSVPLANFLGDNQFSISRKEMEFTVFMKKKPQPGAASGQNSDRQKSQNF
jgi:hypothetical protein